MHCFQTGPSQPTNICPKGLSGGILMLVISSTLLSLLLLLFPMTGFSLYTRSHTQFNTIRASPFSDQSPCGDMEMQSWAPLSLHISENLMAHNMSQAPTKQVSHTCQPFPIAQVSCSPGSVHRVAQLNTFSLEFILRDLFCSNS